MIGSTYIHTLIVIHDSRCLIIPHYTYVIHIVIHILLYLIIGTKQCPIHYKP